jgi:ribosomal protein S2
LTSIKEAYVYSIIAIQQVGVDLGAQRRKTKPQGMARYVYTQRATKFFQQLIEFHKLHINKGDIKWLT